MAPDIAVGLAVLATAKLEDARKCEEARLREEEEQRRRIEAQRHNYIEERRAKVFEQILERVERRDRLRRLVVALGEDLTAAENPRVREFIRWAATVLERAEQRLSAEGLETLFEHEHVFGPDDDRGFYPRSFGW